MHYYQFNIADYRKDTGHLTPVEHHIYRWLIDEYHLSEHPFNNDMTKLLRRMSLGENNRNSLELVLEEFFTPACDDDYEPVNLSDHPEYADIGDHPETCQYWIHNRIEQGISSYKQFIEKKSNAGKASAKARSNKRLTGVQHQPTGVQLTTNHKLPTTNHEPATKDQVTNPKKKKPTFSLQDKKFAEYMFSLIQKINPSAKQPNFNSWANEVRLMREVDNRIEADIQLVFEWANADSFWRGNILSPAKLRKQFDQLIIKSQERKNDPHQRTSGQRVSDKLNEIAKKAAARGDAI